MKQTKHVLLFALSFIFLSPVQAQILNKLKKKVGQSLEDSAVDVVDKSIDKGLDKAENKLIEKMFGVNNNALDSLMANYENPEMQEQIAAMFSGAPVTIDDKYTFSKSVLYKMTTENGKKPTTANYTMMINPDADYMAGKMGDFENEGKKSKSPNMVNIMDYGNNAMIMIMEEQKTVQIFSMSMMSAFGNTEETSKTSVIEKTGKTKDILGYTCEEYHISSEEMNGNMWIAPDLDIFNKSLFQSMSALKFADGGEMSEMKGLMMEMDMAVTPEKGNKTSNMSMNVVSIIQIENEFDMAEYKVNDLSAVFAESKSKESEN